MQESAYVFPTDTVSAGEIPGKKILDMIQQRTGPLIQMTMTMNSLYVARDTAYSLILSQHCTYPEIESKQC